MPNLTQTKGLLIAAATLATAMAATSGSFAAEEKQETEKCYGVAAAGKNDCATATSSCAGTAKADRQKDAFVAVPKGLCEKLAGGRLEPNKS